MTLKVLNAFSFPPVATPWADDVAGPFSGMWRDLERRLRDPSPPKTASDAERERLIDEVSAQYEPFGQGKRRTRIRQLLGARSGSRSVPLRGNG